MNPVKSGAGAVAADVLIWTESLAVQCRGSRRKQIQLVGALTKSP
jgi:hypothetical protein